MGLGVRIRCNQGEIEFDFWWDKDLKLCCVGRLEKCC